VPAIVERTNREHAYDVPCVIALPAFAGNPLTSTGHERDDRSGERVTLAHPRHSTVGL